MRRLGWLLLLLWWVLPAAAQDVVNTNLPDLPPGQQVVITYRAQVGNYSDRTFFTLNQGTVTGSNLNLTFTNDPDTVEGGDATRTPLALRVTVLPATGEDPWWRYPLTGLLLLVGGITLWLGWRSWRITPTNR